MIEKLKIDVPSRGSCRAEAEPGASLFHGEGDVWARSVCSCRASGSCKGPEAK